jgi:alpha-beta hydrolase superfamily lysophospholipase
VPTLILVAGDERLVSTEATRSFHDRLGTGDRTWIDYPGLRHELFNELGRAQVLADLAAWVADRS